MLNCTDGMMLLGKISCDLCCIYQDASLHCLLSQVKVIAFTAAGLHFCSGGAFGARLGDVFAADCGWLLQPQPLVLLPVLVLCIVISWQGGDVAPDDAEYAPKLDPGAELHRQPIPYSDDTFQSGASEFEMTTASNLLLAKLVYLLNTLPQFKAFHLQLRRKDFVVRV